MNQYKRMKKIGFATLGLLWIVIVCGLVLQTLTVTEVKHPRALNDAECQLLYTTNYEMECPQSETEVASKCSYVCFMIRHMTNSSEISETLFCRLEKGFQIDEKENLSKNPTQLCTFLGIDERKSTFPLAVLVTVGLSLVLLTFSLLILAMIPKETISIPIATPTYGNPISHHLT